MSVDTPMQDQQVGTNLDSSPGTAARTGDAMPDDPLMLYGVAFASRLILGTAQYPSPQVLADAISASGCEIVTASLRRETARTGETTPFHDLLTACGVAIMPNTAGCHSAREAVTVAQMAREFFDTDWIKLEVIANADTLAPNPFELVEATRILTDDGFSVFPYTTDDLAVAERLLEAGAQVLMPWGAPIGTGQGLINPYALRSLRAHLPDVPMVIDAGIGAPSHAAHAMELGYDAVMLSTAVGRAADPAAMGVAFAEATRAGRRGRIAGLMEPRDMAAPSTPVLGTPFRPIG